MVGMWVTKQNTATCAVSFALCRVWGQRVVLMVELHLRGGDQEHGRVPGPPRAMCRVPSRVLPTIAHTAA